LRGTKAGSVERADCPIHMPGEDAPAKIQIQDLAEIARFSKGAPWRVADPAQISDALANCNENVSSMKRYFVYSAVTLFNTTNTSIDSDPFTEEVEGDFSDWFSSHAKVSGSTPSVCLIIFIHVNVHLHLT
jgi:hypothetical protein